jgi:hypothetical protein
LSPQDGDFYTAQMNTAELDRLAPAELKDQGFVLLADILGRAQLEPPRAVGTKTLAQWALFVFLVVMDVFLVFLAVTLP